MNRTGVIAAVFAIAAVAAVYVAVQSRDMSNPGFIIAAYGIVAAVLALYIWSLAGRLRAARDERSRSAAAETREPGGAAPPGS